MTWEHPAKISVKPTPGFLLQYLELVLYSWAQTHVFIVWLTALVFSELHICTHSTHKVFCTYKYSSSDVLFRHWAEIMVFMFSTSFDHFCEWSPIARYTSNNNASAALHPPAGNTVHFSLWKKMWILLTENCSVDIMMVFFSRCVLLICFCGLFSACALLGYYEFQK